MAPLLSKAPQRSAAEASDEQLLVRYRDAGNIEAFEQLVGRYERPLYNYLLRYVNDTALAEDLFQGTFLRVHQRCHQFAADGRARPWIYSIATHLAIDALRKAGRQKTTSLSQTAIVADEGVVPLLELVRSHMPSPAEEMEMAERARWAREAVDTLPDELRVILLLAYFQGLKLQEVAEILQLPIGTVKSRLHRALTMLSAAWRRSEAGAAPETSRP